MKTIADLIRSTGAANSRGGQDTILAHINPREAALLKALGGSGRTDPVTGAIHFDEGNDGGSSNEGSDSYGSSDNNGGGWDSGSWDSGYTSDSDAISQNAEAAANAAEGFGFDAFTGADPFSGRTDEEQFAYNAGFGIGQAQGPNASQEALDAARSEYNSLGWQGALQGDPWSYVDAKGENWTNWGSVGRDTAQALAQYGGIVGALTGFGALGAGVGALANMALGNYGPGLGTIGGLMAGAPGALAGNVLGNLAAGKEGNALGTLANAGLNYAGLGLGPAFAGQFDRGSLEAYLASQAGSMLQGNLVGGLLNNLGIENTGQAFGGWTGAPGNMQVGDDFADSGSATVGGLLGSFTNVAPNDYGTTAPVTPSAPTTQTAPTMQSGGQGATGYVPITLDKVNAETGYDLIAEDYNSPLTLGNLLGTQNLYASSYGG